MALTPTLLVANAVTGAKSLQVAMYLVGLAAFVACAGPFLSSLRRNGAGILLVLLFSVLTASTAAALLAGPSANSWLAAKGLAATMVWASIYFVVFLAIRTPACVIRLVKWIHPVCFALSVSVCVGALCHLFGWTFGEIIEQTGRCISGIWAAGRSSGIRDRSTRFDESGGRTAIAFRPSPLCVASHGHARRDGVSRCRYPPPSSSRRHEDNVENVENVAAPLATRASRRDRWRSARSCGSVPCRPI